MPDAIAIGIDLGTSNSCVAIARGRNVEVLPNAFGEGITASVVHFLEDGSVLVGNAAKKNIIPDPKHTVYSREAPDRPLLLLRRGEEGAGGDAVQDRRGPEQQRCASQVRDEQFSLPEISALVLKEMKAHRRERTSASR